VTASEHLWIGDMPLSGEVLTENGTACRPDGPSQPQLPPVEAFNDHAARTVASLGHLYVARHTQLRIEKFNSAVASEAWEPRRSQPDSFDYSSQTWLGRGANCSTS